MKNLLFPFIFWGVAASIYAQTLRVLDKTNLQPLAAVTVYQAAKSDLTNARGEIDLSTWDKNVAIEVRYLGFQKRTLTWADLELAGFEIYLTQRSFDLDEVVISSSKFEEKRADVLAQVQVIRAKEIAFMSQQTTADVLQQSGNVLVQKSQQGGGSPIMRGFEANKVMITIDGIRMNNAIYRAGHLQNVITLDNTILDKVEIIFGPGSVMYGSDALGGVMHFHTRNPFLSGGKMRVSGNAFTRYATANEEKTGHLDLNIGLKKIAFLTSLTHSDFGDMMMGSTRNPAYGDWGKRPWYVERQGNTDVQIPNSNINRQVGSGYTQFDFLQKVLWKVNEGVQLTLNVQHSTTSDLPRYDRLQELRNGLPRQGEWYYGPQKRWLAAAHLDLTRKSRFYDAARITIAHQNIEESRITRNWQSPNRDSRVEWVRVWSLNADFSRTLAGRHELRYGIDLNWNDVWSRATRLNINTQVEIPWDTRYPAGGNQMRMLAAYLSYNWEISPRVILSAGARYTDVSLRSNLGDKVNFAALPYNDFVQRNSALNGNLGVIYQPGAEWRIALSGASGFRAPNLDDVGKIFESSATGNNNTLGTVVVPNPTLRPEYTYNIDLSIGKTFAQAIRAELTGFYTWFRDAIVLRPSTYNGQAQITYNGFPAVVVASQNAQNAYLTGFSANLSADVTPSFSITSSLNYTYARVKNDDGSEIPLDHIAPIFGRTSLVLRRKKFQGEFWVMYNGWKYLRDFSPSGEDNLPYATPNGYPAWTTLNLRGAYQVNQFLQVQVALENMADVHYRVFASGFSAAGRNLMVTLRGRF